MSYGMNLDTSSGNAENMRSKMRKMMEKRADERAKADAAFNAVGIDNPKAVYNKVRDSFKGVTPESKEDVDNALGKVLSQDFGLSSDQVDSLKAQLPQFMGKRKMAGMGQRREKTELDAFKEQLVQMGLDPKAIRQDAKGLKQEQDMSMRDAMTQALANQNVSPDKIAVLMALLPQRSAMVQQAQVA